MSLQIVRKALEKHLATLLPALSIAYENVTFQPVAGVAYMRVNLLPNTPDNNTQGAAVYWERGLFQVTLAYPAGTGPAAADTQAQALRTHYKRGTSMLETGVTVIVTETPRVSPGFIDGDRFSVPISIPFQAQINA